MFITRRDGMLARTSEYPLTVDVWVTGGLWTMYEVNVGEHLLDFQCELPCQQNVGHFLAKVHLAWKVSDPQEVVKRHLVDVRGELEPWLCGRMRQITRTIDVRQRAYAEERINNKLGNNPRLPTIGLEICRFKVTLELDEAARRHVDRLTETDRKKEAEEREQKLLRARMDFARSVLELGYRESILLQLARHPEDIKDIVQMLQNDEEFVLDANVEAFKAMLGSRLFEEFDVDPTRLTLLEQLLEDVQARFRNRLPGSDARKHLLDIEQPERIEEPDQSKAETGPRERHARGGREESGGSNAESTEGPGSQGG
ncbi:MAG: hypothetical protein ACRDZ4_17625 [Egibacteraceae bacterium]